MWGGWGWLGGSGWSGRLLGEAGGLTRGPVAAQRAHVRSDVLFT